MHLVRTCLRCAVFMPHDCLPDGVKPLAVSTLFGTRQLLASVPIAIIKCID